MSAGVESLKKKSIRPPPPPKKKSATACKDVAKNVLLKGVWVPDVQTVVSGDQNQNQLQTNKHQQKSHPSSLTATKEES